MGRKAFAYSRWCNRRTVWPKMSEQELRVVIRSAAARGRFLISRIVFLAVGLFVFALLAGCGTLETFPDPEQTESEMATLEGYWRYLFLYDEKSGISSVDGKRADNFSGYWDSVRLSSGSHWIEFKINRYGSGTVARCSFELPFNAKHHYQIKSLKHKGLLAHPISSPYNASISIEITAPGQPVQKLSVATVCTSGELLCRQDSDCSPDYVCQTETGFDSGTCKLRVRKSIVREGH